MSPILPINKTKTIPHIISEAPNPDPYRVTWIFRALASSESERGQEKNVLVKLSDS